MIKFEDVTFGYKSKKVFNNASFELTEGNVYGLLGLNGAGKSTMLYLMSGLLFAESGKVTFDGYDMRQRHPEALRDIYIVPEEFSLPNMTFDKYIKINAPFYPRFSMQMLEKSLAAFNMTRDLHLGQLSMGQKKKAFMCFALATNTRLLLMDEPSNGLDIPSKSQFRRAVAECMSDERTIIISTHQVRDVENLLDRIMIVDNGQMLCDKSTLEISSKLDFVQVGVGQTVENVIYTQPSTIGSVAVVKKTSNEETPLNIELFFNAMLAEREKMNEALRN
ncbi:MAG: ATP-binding cassette domain-containing protein [Bacteroidales bacterium]|nr:ATP-binding cassette domain-containing protein [Bacteroidales bacterium]